MFALTDDHKSHLSLLFDQPSPLLLDFCKLALESLTKGPNLKLFSAAAQKLQVEVNIVQRAIEAVIHLLLESRRHTLSKSDFQDLLLAAGFSEGQDLVLCEFYESNLENVDAVLCSLSPSMLHYHDIEWRFDVQVASRALPKQITPLLTMKLTLEERPSSRDDIDYRSILLQTDPNNLKHMIQKLDEALQEASSQHNRKLQRIFK